MAFRIALSGLDAASTDLEVTGHNIANASTVGFKKSRAEFADIYANSLGAVSTVSGRGVRVSDISQQFGQGSIDFTSKNLDLALNGEGFFVVQDGEGSRSFTRAGSFNADRDGYVVNNTQSRLQVFPPVDPAGALFNTGATTDLNLPVVSGDPSPTSAVTATVNLDASETVPGTPFNSAIFPPVANSYNHSTATTIYDSLGAPHTMSVYYVKEAANPNQWSAYTFVDDANVPALDGSTAADLRFDTSGLLIPGVGDVDANGVVTMSTFTPAVGTAPITGMTFNYNASTQFGAGFAVNQLTQDGYTSGTLSGVDVDASGVVFARFTNGRSEALGKVALAHFNNEQGLQQVGDTSWVESFSSGDAQLGEAGSSGIGVIQSGALENSNVDIARQLVYLITAQRNFQANAQVITTSDAITQTVINIR